MPEDNVPVRVAALLGPTAVGKTRLAVELAPSLNAEIISVDSMQIYRGMDIGTAKPGPELLEKVPHHLIGFVDPGEDFSVAEFQKVARKAVEDVHARGKLPMLVGGSGLYFEAVVFDVRFPPGSVDDQLRRELESWVTKDPEGASRRLREIDPLFSRREDSVNPRRMVRALEVFERTGRPISDFQAKRGEYPVFHPYSGVVIDAPRESLYRAIDKRVDEMVAEGLIDEVKALASAGRLSRTASKALGYEEIMAYLNGELSIEGAAYEIKMRSRRYAKRQVTWFRRIPGLHWMILKPGEPSGRLSPIRADIRRHLSGEFGYTGMISGGEGEPRRPPE